MTDINKILDINYLKENHTRIYYFGLGFIQVVLNKYERVHFYTDELPTTNEDIHNHRYNFTSTILKGSFRNHKYKLVSGDTHILKNESCNLEKELENNVSIPVSIELIELKEYNQGESYDMFFNELHAVEYTDNTITYLKRTDIITDYAQVLYKKDSEEVCPFSNKVETDKLWELIELILTK